ncbi:glycosyltransferase family 4 protein [Halostagnicola sp. A56]|uniref:glycosyltransferase family 4 protein n=1 Tax=Halostagnicola sp. A56 TaxID=1495067 RepID=UPI0018CD8225|nr:glycosyltransferase family 4 protein [Halostagnicola sp. A56]
MSSVSLTRRKGKETVERNIPKILERRPDLQFAFVGKQHKSLHLPSKFEGRVTIIGSVEPSEIPKYYRGADFLVHPSLTEGVPRAVLEALACGLPVVARDVGDISYVTENTFQMESDFVETVCEFESLPVDSLKKFSRDVVGKKYYELTISGKQNT